MASIQDISSRLRSVEDRLSFIMSSIQMQMGIETGLLNASGQKEIKVIAGPLEKLYLLSRQLELKPAGQEAIPAEIVEATNVG